MNDNLKRQLESLRAEKAATEKSIGRYRVRKDHRMVADLTEYAKKLGEDIAKLEIKIRGGQK